MKATMTFPKIRLIWQTPLLYKYAGLYLRINDKRYRLFRVGGY